MREALLSVASWRRHGWSGEAGRGMGRDVDGQLTELSSSRCCSAPHRFYDPHRLDPPRRNALTLQVPVSDVFVMLP